MKFTETQLTGAFLIAADAASDARGFFARLWCEREFAQRGLSTRIAQISLSYNAHKGTLRGLHYQRAPYEEVKYLRCTHGAIFDVIVDLRPESASYLQWCGLHLSAGERNALYIPAGFAHGFQTLEDATEVLYQISEFYVPGYEAGIRFDDPALAIGWPLDVTVMSDRDRAWGSLEVRPQASGNASAGA